MSDADIFRLQERVWELEELLEKLADRVEALEKKTGFPPGSAPGEEGEP